MKVTVPWWHPREISIAAPGSLTLGVARVTHPDGCFHPSESAGTSHELADEVAPFLLPDEVADSLGRGSGFGAWDERKN